MHIVYVTWHFVQSENEVLEGGIDNYLYKISKYMQKKGHSVTIVAAGKKECRWQYEGVPVYTVEIPFRKYLEHYQWSKYLFPIFREIAFNKALRIINREKSITIVQYAAGFGTGLLYNKKLPAVLRVSTYTRIENKGTKVGLEYKIPVLYEKMAARRFSNIFTPSKSCGRILAKEIRKKVYVIHTPYEIEAGLVEDDSIYCKDLYRKKYFLYFGRLHPIKGTETIARCIYDILERNPEHLICFAGPMDNSIATRQWRLMKKSAGVYKERVIYVGNLKHTQLYPIIRHAECILMPSNYDNLPNACLEALILNGIVIGTKRASFEEIYKDGESGYLIELDNSAQLLQKIDTVVSMSASEKEAMREKARSVLKNFTFDKLGGKLERYYENVIREWQR
ncbi:MAG: glycosyltransferase family 4 protein [Lachnospiraceae bacterium]|nr:glycosyltransferase family 4 protein [Lachnospiraceae bacterium]